MELIGSHYVLAVLPIWTTTAVLTAILMAVVVGRDINEGLSYNVAYSSLVGDVGLMIVVLIGATILQRGNVQIQQWLQIPAVHNGIFSASILLSIILSKSTSTSRSSQKMDIYHDVIIVPLFIYLIATLIPVIFKNGTKVEVTATLGFGLLWAALFSFDIKHHRLDQRHWLRSHGITLTRGQ